MTRILMTFCHLSWQKGSVAQVISFVQEWRRVNGPAQFTIVSQFPDRDRRLAAELGVTVVGHGSGRRSSPDLQNLKWLASLALAVLCRIAGRRGPALARSMRNEVAAVFLETDLVADLSGDSYRDRPGGFSPAHNFLLICLSVIGRPVCLVSQSLGPFHPINHAVTCRALNGAACIYLREQSTPHILNTIGATTAPRRLGPDIAFCLPVPPPGQRAETWRRVTGGAESGNETWVGISTNSLMLDFTGFDGPYIDQMVALIRHARTVTAGKILLIPHVIHDANLGVDDVEPCRLIAAELGDPGWLCYPTDDLSPVELKGLVVGCEVLVAARMHAGIAGLSGAVPTAFLSWSHKYRALLAEIGMQRFNWEFAEHSNADLLRIFDELWASRVAVRQELEVYNAGARGVIAEILRFMKHTARGSARTVTIFSSTQDAGPLQ